MRWWWCIDFLYYCPHWVFSFWFCFIYIYICTDSKLALTYQKSLGTCSNRFQTWLVLKCFRDLLRQTWGLTWICLEWVKTCWGTRDLIETCLKWHETCSNRNLKHDLDLSQSVSYFNYKLSIIVIKNFHLSHFCQCFFRSQDRITTASHYHHTKRTRQTKLQTTLKATGCIMEEN